MTESTRKTLTRPIINKPAKVAKSANQKKPHRASQVFNENRKPHKASNDIKPNTRVSISPEQPELLALKADSLALSLSAAAQAVSYVLDGTALPQALSRVFAQEEYTPQMRGAIQDISYRTMRQVGRVDALITLMTNKR